MSNLLLSPDSCDPCNVHIRDIGQPPQRVYPPSFSGARKGTPGLGGGAFRPTSDHRSREQTQPLPLQRASSQGSAWEASCSGPGK